MLSDYIRLVRIRPETDEETIEGYYANNVGQKRHGTVIRRPDELREIPGLPSAAQRPADDVGDFTPREMAVIGHIMGEWIFTGWAELSPEQRSDLVEKVLASTWFGQTDAAIMIDIWKDEGSLPLVDKDPIMFIFVAIKEIILDVFKKQKESLKSAICACAMEGVIAFVEGLPVDYRTQMRDHRRQKAALAKLEAERKAAKFEREISTIAKGT